MLLTMIEIKRTYRVDDLVVPADHKVNKKKQYIDLARELRNYGT